MYQAVVKLIETEQIDFLYIPIPSHFAALIGRLAHRKTGVKYGIDYIDPWVHHWPGTEKKFSRHWWSMKIGDWLEPIAVKNVSMITGVAPGYYEPVLARNPHLQKTCVTAAMPYGGEQRDHEKVKEISDTSLLFNKNPGVLDFVYAGAMLPKAFKPLAEIMKAISEAPELYTNTRIHFIGSGKAANDANSFNIKTLAQEYNLWETVFFEYPKRIPYLSVLQHLDHSDGAFILGSTEPHYTPSKVYQAALSKKPIFAVLHQASSACKVIEQSKVGVVLAFDGEQGLSAIHDNFNAKWKDFAQYRNTFDADTLDLQYFEQYSARAVTKILAEALEKI